MKITNKRARYEYQLFDKFEAGLVLSGPEVKSIKLGRGDISSAYVRIRDGEAWLVGANIPPFQGVGDPLRSRKLLLHKKELVSLSTKTKQQKLALVPLTLYTKGNRIKAQVALARGKKQFEKREAKKRKDIERDTEKELRGKI